MDFYIDNNLILGGVYDSDNRDTYVLSLPSESFKNEDNLDYVDRMQMSRVEISVKLGHETNPNHSISSKIIWDDVACQPHFESCDLSCVFSFYGKILAICVNAFMNNLEGKSYAFSSSEMLCGLRICFPGEFFCELRPANANFWLWWLRKNAV